MIKGVAGAVLVVVLSAAAVATLVVVARTLFVERSSDALGRLPLSVAGRGLLVSAGVFVPVVAVSQGFSFILPALTSSMLVLVVTALGLLALCDVALKETPRSGRWWSVYLLLCMLAAFCTALLEQI